MAEKIKGNSVGSFRHTFARQNGSDNPVQQAIYPKTVGGLETNTEYIIEFKSPGKSDVNFSGIEPFLVKTYNENPAFSVPIEIIRENNILPGHTAVIKIYEVDEVQNYSTQFANASSVIGRAQVVGDETKSDDCRTTLDEKSVYEYLGDGAAQIKFRNLKNGKEARSVISRNSTEYEFSFPISVRRSINAEQGDLIEIIVESRDVDNGEQGQSQEEKIDQMHEMVSELYDAYTAAKND